MVQEQVLELIKVAMPPTADLDVDSRYGELDVRLSWKLGDDPSRPNKRSRTVRITLAQEAADDIEDAEEMQQVVALERIGSFLRAKFDAFDPHHDAPRDVPPPVEHWLITHDMALG